MSLITHEGKVGVSEGWSSTGGGRGDVESTGLGGLLNRYADRIHPHRRYRAQAKNVPPWVVRMVDPL